ncbi:hypothetical protein [Glaciecola sp. KUL10]|uniref:hypothetical protein n=1 Tax=Glaciecola sp. (strain KUL10) TaxID=2161813 RepID=UPI000D96FC77|nr:hypothetical protein [Glaciecola sp. KUL10]GBL05204.1 ATP-dependent exoDNAse subunit alpha [Glaciecola sp. KUL10]
MNLAVHEEQMRVTSIPYKSPSMVIISGVPLKKNSYKANSSRYYITIKINPDSIPVHPVQGQHWLVKGKRVIEEMESDDYVMQQHTYESPQRVACRLPETGEQLIHLLA